MDEQRRRRWLIIGLPIATIHLVGLWALAQSILTSRAEQFTARQQAFDPRELWSIEVLPGRAGWQPVKLCTDARTRSGFLTPLPSVGGAPCMPTSPARKNVNRLSIRCEIGGARYLASSVVEGDTASAFTVAYRVVSLDGGPWDKAASYAQTRRYRRLGPCPDGWAVGASSDRTGARNGRALADITTGVARQVR